MPVIPFAFQWSIPEHELLALKDYENACLYTGNVSNIPGFEYYFSIYPNESDGENHGQTWIGLHLMKLGKVKKVEAHFFVFIESANCSFEEEYTYEESTGWGDDVCKTEEFFQPEKKFIVDGKCIIKVHGIFKFEADDAPPSEYQKWDGGELGNELWEEKDDKNFTIVVDGKELQVDKIFLRTRSDVFRAMFNPETKESIENKVEIPDFPFDVVETAVKMIYNCNFTSSLSLDETMLLLQFFDKYQISSLKDKVEPLLINEISAATVCRLTNCSIFTNSIHLKIKCMEVLMDAFASKTYLSDIETLDKDVLVEVVQSSLYKNIETEQF